MPRMILPLLALAAAAFALAEAPDDYGMTPEEAHALIEASGDEVFFVDVRDPVEIMFTGMTDAVDLNIPFLLVDRTRWNERRNTFAMDRNPNFTEQVAAALAERGLDRDARIITLCRTGSARGRPSAEYLREQGFPNAYYVIGGFQGDPIREGPHAGRRMANGWQNAGLPWQNEINPEKIYRGE